MLNKALTPIAAALVLVTGSVHAENLVDVFNAAVKNDPQFLAAAFKRDSAQEGIVQARSALLPQVNASAGMSAGTTETTTSGSLLGPNGTTESDSEGKSLSLRLDQQIYHHDTYVGLSQAKKRAKQSELAYAGEGQTLVIRVSQAYFDVLAAQDGVEFSTAELESVKKQLEQTNQRFQVGLIAVTDVHEAQARYDQTNANLIVAQNTLDNAWESLRQITGQYYNNINALDPKFPLSTSQPATAEDWIRVASENNLTLQSQRLSVDIAREEIKRRNAGHLPTLDLTGTMSKTDNDTETLLNPNLNTETDGASVGLTLSIPIYSGNRTSSQATQASHDFEVATQDLERTHRQVVRDSKSAYLGLIASASAVKALEQAEVSAQAALEATQAGFDVGTRTIVDVLQSTSDLYQAKRNLQQARYSYVLNTLKLKAAAGTITDADLGTVNGWLKP